MSELKISRKCHTCREVVLLTMPLSLGEVDQTCPQCEGSAYSDRYSSVIVYAECGYTPAEIARIMKISRQRVSQILLELNPEWSKHEMQVHAHSAEVRFHEAYQASWEGGKPIYSDGYRKWLDVNGLNERADKNKVRSEKSAVKAKAAYEKMLDNIKLGLPAISNMHEVIGKKKNANVESTYAYRLARYHAERNGLTWPLVRR